MDLSTPTAPSLTGTGTIQQWAARILGLEQVRVSDRTSPFLDLVYRYSWHHSVTPRAGFVRVIKWADFSTSLIVVVRYAFQPQWTPCLESVGRYLHLYAQTQSAGARISTLDEWQVVHATLPDSALVGVFSIMLD